MKLLLPCAHQASPSEVECRLCLRPQVDPRRGGCTYSPAPWPASPARRQPPVVWREERLLSAQLCEVAHLFAGRCRTAGEACACSRRTERAPAGARRFWPWDSRGWRGGARWDPANKRWRSVVKHQFMDLDLLDVCLGKKESDKEIKHFKLLPGVTGFVSMNLLTFHAQCIFIIAFLFLRDQQDLLNCLNWHCKGLAFLIKTTNLYSNHLILYQQCLISAFIFDYPEQKEADCVWHHLQESKPLLSCSMSTCVTQSLELCSWFDCNYTIFCQWVTTLMENNYVTPYRAGESALVSPINVYRNWYEDGTWCPRMFITCFAIQCVYVYACVFVSVGVNLFQMKWEALVSRV